MNDDRDPPRTPAWVKVFGVIAIVLIALLVLSLLFGGGSHGPGRHQRGARSAAEQRE